MVKADPARANTSEPEVFHARQGISRPDYPVRIIERHAMSGIRRPGADKYAEPPT